MLLRIAFVLVLLSVQSVFAHGNIIDLNFLNPRENKFDFICDKNQNKVAVVKQRFCMRQFRSVEYYTTIQSAIRNADALDVIYVGPGVYPEFLSIANKVGITLSSPCKAQIQGMTISQSAGISIEGFKITGSKYSAAVSLQKQNALVEFKNNEVVNNPYNGVVFDNQSIGGPFYFENNIISENGMNGVVFNSKNTIYFDYNKVVSNGNLYKNTENGYGIKLIDSKNFHTRNNQIKLKNNKILFNNGKEVENVSSIDIGNFKSLFTKKSHNNTTSYGKEGVGVIAFKDNTMPQLNVTAEENFRTTQKKYFIKVSIADASPVFTEIFQNESLIYSSGKNEFSIEIDLKEGLNTFEVKTTDFYSNVSKQVYKNIILDTTPPVITASYPDGGEIFYTNKLPLKLNALIVANENLLKASVNSQFLNQISETKAQGEIELNIPGEQPLSFQATDLVNLSSSRTVSVDVKLDQVSPLVYLTLDPVLSTKEGSFKIPVVILDDSPTEAQIYINKKLLFSTGSKNFEAAVTLENEGSNLFEIVVSDAAGNIAEKKSATIVRDTTAPILTFVTPLENDVVNGIQFLVKVNSNEPLANASINEESVQLALNSTIIEKLVTVVEDGEVQIKVKASDALGNTSTQQIKVQSILKALNASLIGIYPDEKNNKLMIKGAVGATRPNLEVKFSTGFFSSDEITADERGSFLIILDPFAQIKVSVYDPVKNETLSAILTYGENADTILSGVVRDTNDQPLAGATVKVVGTQLSSKTNGEGVFKFSRTLYPDTMVTGDQQLEIDGTTIIIPEDGVARKFSKTIVSIAVGVKQSNVLQTPIYLAPILLDEATEIKVASGGVVTDAHAPGVELMIPNNAAEFPSNAAAEKISLQEIPVKFATVSTPNGATPTTIVALEPSGTTFSKPVKLTLPNVNEFPPKTEMAILLMNSKTGKWELGGAAQVSEDGQSVVTKPGLGIRHFSLVYATIAGPAIKQIGAQDRPGADSFNGALSNKIELPSFKSFGQNVTPTLFYKSNWARPTAVVTNLFDLPNRKVDIDLQSQYSSQIQSYEVKIPYCTWPSYLDTSHSSGGGKVEDNEYCDIDIQKFFRNVQYRVDYQNVTSEIQPEKIEAYLRTSNIQSEKVTFQNIPHSAAMTFGLDLISDSQTGEYLTTGIYPYQSHFDIHFKQLIMGKSTLTYWNEVMNAVTEPGEDLNKVYEGKLFTQDYNDSLFVQNYKKSEAGVGWKIGGYQRIVNPESNKLMIEETDGAISSYSIKNTIDTVLDLNALNGNLTKGVSLNSWPRVAYSSKISDQILLTEYTGNAPLTSVLGSPFSVAGRISSFDYYNYTTQTTKSERNCRWHYDKIWGGGCGAWENIVRVTNHPNSYCSNYAYNYNLPSSPSQMILTDSNYLIGVDSQRHVMFDMNSGSSSHMLGALVDMPTQSNFYQAAADTGDQRIQNYCNGIAGLVCSPKVIQNIQNIGAYNACPPSATSYGQIPVASREIVNGQQALNSPMGIIIGADQSTVVIADTGNYVVRLYNLITKSSQIIAGNGQDFDTGDGGLATQAAIGRPRGLAYDSQGNLYISTSRGFIRKVDVNGFISTIAGNPISGELAQEGPSIKTKFNEPYGLAVDKQNNYLYVADTGHNRVVKIDLNSNYASTVAGSGQALLSGDGGPANLAGLSAPTHLWVDSDHNLIIADSGNNRIRKVSFQNSSLGTLAFAPTTDDNSALKRQSDGTWVRTYRSGDKVFFDQSGYQYAAQNKLGQVTEYKFDSSKRLTQIKLPTNQSIEYNYSGYYLSSITDAAGRVTNFNYNGSNQLSEVIYPDGSTKKYSYDNHGVMLSETNQNGALTQYQYNVYGRIEKVIAPDNTSVVINDSASSNLKDYIASESSQGAIQPKSMGDADHNLNESIFDPNGNKTEIVKDDLGYVVTMTDALGRKSIIKRDLKGRPIEVQSADGIITKNTFDNLTGDLLATENIQLGLKEEKTYNEFGQILTEKNANGNVFTKQYNQYGQLVKDIAPDGSFGAYEYNSQGLLSKKIITAQNQTLVSSYDYNSRGDLIQITDASGKIAEYTHDSSGNVIQSKVGADITSYQFDEMNRLIKVTSPKSEATQYEYLPTGELAKVIDPKENETVFQYNLKNQLIKKVDPKGASYAFSYDANGNAEQEIDPNGQVKTYIYDELNQLIKAQLPDDTINYQYTVKGELAVAANKISQVSYLRDEKGRVKKMNFSGLGALNDFKDYSLNQEFDFNGNRLKLVTDYGLYQYSYDTLNRLTGLSNLQGEVFGFNYDTASRLTRVSRPGGYSEFSYNSNSSLAKINHFVGTSIKSFNEYAYNEKNYPIQKKTIAGDFSYSYDVNGQLASSTSPVQSESFNYDPLGNRITDQDGNYIYDEKAQLLKEDSQYLYSYDLNGNMISKVSRDPSKETYSFTYSSSNQLVKVKITQGLSGPLLKEIEYFYDVLGRRMQKSFVDHEVPGNSYSRRYLYDGENIFAELDGSNELLAKYTYSPLKPDDILSVYITNEGKNQKLAQTSGSFYYLKDHLGSVTDIVDTSGDVVQKYNYSSFGKILKITDGADLEITNSPKVNTSYTYTGREFEKESNLFYYRARFYDPSTGRFLQKDPHPGATLNPVSVNNFYIYAANNPNSYTDPDGKVAWLIIIAVAVISGGMNAMRAQEADHGANTAKFWESFAVGAISGAVQSGIALTGGFGYAVLGGVTGTVMNNIGNQLVFNGRVSNWNSIGVAGLFGGIGAGVGFGVGKIFGAYISNAPTRVIGNPAGYMNTINYGAEIGSFIGSYVPSGAADSGIPSSCSAENCMGTSVP